MGKTRRQRGGRVAIKNKLKTIKAEKTEIDDFLEKITYSKIDKYIEKNITTNQSIKDYLKKLTKLVIYHIKEK